MAQALHLLGLMNTPTVQGGPSPARRLEEAVGLMRRFAERTRIGGERPEPRYLWTDAFAVCSFLELARLTRDARYGELALQLVDDVHRTLGRHRGDDGRRGWLSGLSDEANERHPTRGGLRIGKPLPERPAGAPLDEQLEWQRDGQYFHYLTQWMHALDQVARHTRQPRYNLWARELARAAYAGFAGTRRGGPRGGPSGLAWKMSIDLSRPLVPAMGQHDPLDGFVAAVQLRATAQALASHADGPSLDEEIAGLRAMFEGTGLASADPLGLGGLLVAAGRVAQLRRAGALADDDLLEALLTAALEGLWHYAQLGDFRQPPSRRLAFRELGLAIGLKALDRIEPEASAGASSSRAAGSSAAHVRALLAALRPYAEFGAALGSEWLEAGPRLTRTWAEHRDINDVMLAASLLPEGVVRLPDLA